MHEAMPLFTVILILISVKTTPVAVVVFCRGWSTPCIFCKLLVHGEYNEYITDI